MILRTLVRNLEKLVRKSMPTCAPKISLEESEKRKILFILGPTGCGKTKLSIEICKKFDGEIVSTDSMQIYRALDIATNKITVEEMENVPHHMMSFLDPLTLGYTVVNFRNQALNVIADIHSRGKLPVVVGGTNYYVEALLWKILLVRVPHNVTIFSQFIYYFISMNSSASHCRCLFRLVGVVASSTKSNYGFSRLFP
uniref:Uncharacterized protein n=1 Tax=Romanomermis culicivorax TaxID=13658 RepID=A0A915IR55_ROMCU